jgi:predicted Zn finger-like uncharacterized protein
MASARITCPECKSVLRPAKPIADGKKVKCPECGTIFTTPGLIEQDESPRPKPAAKKKNQAGIKKAGAVKPPPKKPAPDDDDDDGGGIYSFVGADEEKKTEEEEEERPQIEYAPDMSIKDLRGPAQAAVVKPSNYLLLLGGLNCLADVFIICYSFWPMVFSESVFFDWQKELTAHYLKIEDKTGANRIKMYKERKELKDKDDQVMSELEDEEKISRFIQMGIYIGLLIYTGIAVFGAVKMQNLESRGWGIAASIMLILPMGSAGLSGLFGGVFHNTIGTWIMDEPADSWSWGFYSIILAVAPYLCALYAGVLSLRALLSKEVIDGFNYVAD